jgi:parallel beta-helix repeat protein
MPVRQMRPRARALAIAAVAMVLMGVVAPVASIQASSATPTLWTGQADYAPESVVDVHGSGFEPGARYAIPVQRPDGSIVLVDPVTHVARPGWDTVTAAADGSLSYSYQLDGIQGGYEARAYPPDWNGDWTRAPIASVAFTDKASADIDQCANGPTGVVTSCPGSGSGGDWQNGDLNRTNSAFREGDSVPFRIKFAGTSGSNTVSLSWLVIKSPKHAYDYLTTWKRTVTGANPCDGVPGCVLASPTSTFPIPTDPTVAASCGFVGFQVPGVFTMWGAVITSVSAYGLSGCAPTASDQTNTITITFTATTSTPVLAWGGHLASEANWGAGTAAGSISGAPYHMGLDACSFNCGAQDRSIQGGTNSPVLPVPDITTTADPTTVNVNEPVTDTATITGTASSGFPSGSVDFYYCGPAATAPDCSLGGTLVGTSPVVPAAVNPAYTGTATSPSFAPTAEGVYCFRAVYNPDSNAQYSSFQHTDQTLECFTAGNPNNVESGSLKISKVLDAGGSGFDTATEFTIGYSCDNGGPAGTVNLAGGDDQTINDIPVGSVCSVDETTQPAPPAGYSWSVVITGSPTAAISANNTESVTVTNTLRSTTSAATGSLKITKTLDTGGSSFDTSTTFDIDYDCGGAYAGSFQLEGGQDTTIPGIPVGSTCTVSEPSQPAAPAGYSWSVVITGSPTAAISANQTESVTVANSLTRDTGSLKITKTVDAGGSSFAAGSFDVHVVCTADGGTYNRTIAWPASGNVTIGGIPSGTSCTVTETAKATPPTGYSWSAEVITGSPASITAGGTATVTVANALARDTGSLKITKTVDAGGSSFASGSFDVHVVCTADGGTYNRTIAWPNPGYVTITGIPSGTSCTVTETGLSPAPFAYTWSTVISGSTAAIAKGSTAYVTVANKLTRIAATCTEDPTRAALLTRTVDTSKPLGIGPGVPGNPKNYWLVQAAYDDAASSGEVIGLFSNTTENIALGGSKSLTITQCTLAKVTAKVSTKPVWDITSTGKLTIVGPDAAGGTIGWRVAGNGGHTLKSIRANGASLQGILVLSSNNSVGWNDVSGNGNGTATAAGIRVEVGAIANVLIGGTVGSNKGDGVQLAGNGNQLSGATIQSNTGNGICVTGSANTVTGNSRINLNGKNGILVTGSSNILTSNASESGKGNSLNGIQVSSGTGNQLTDNKMISNKQAGINVAANTGSKLKSNAAASNTGNEFTIGSGNVDQGGNKKNGIAFTFTSVGGTFN